MNMGMKMEMKSTELGHNNVETVWIGWRMKQ